MEGGCGGFSWMICTCEGRKTAEVDSGVASARVAARVVAETANANPGASLGFVDSDASSPGEQRERERGRGDTLNGQLVDTLGDEITV